MQVKDIELVRNFIRLEQPLKISFHTFTHYENYFVRLQTDSGAVGYGEGAPFAPVTGDSFEEALAELRLKSTLFCRPFANLPEISEVLSGITARSLRAALDAALLDAWGKEAGLPVFRLFSETANSAPNSVTVFLSDSVEETKKTAADIFARYPHLRLLKIKLAGQEDLPRCRAIKSLAPAEMRFMLDGNQGFAEPETAIETILTLTNILGDVLLIEEPCRAKDYESMQRIKRCIGIPLFADESCLDADDLPELIKHQACDGINIKLQKCGGILAGLELARRAQSAGLSVMVGSACETALGIAASCHFASAIAGLVASDLDMDLDLPDPFGCRPDFRDGRRVPVPMPGLGLSAQHKAPQT